MITGDTGQTHMVNQVTCTEWHYLCEYNETELGTTTGGVGNFAQAIKSEPSHSLPVIQGEKAGPSSHKYYSVMIN